jgi:hypothetical protein
MDASTWYKLELVETLFLTSLGGCDRPHETHYQWRWKFSISGPLPDSYRFL